MIATEGRAARPRLSREIEARIAGDDARIVITGAGGWLGMATLELLAGALGDGLGDRIRCYGARARDLVLRDGIVIPQRPLVELGELETRPTILLHLAFLTKDRAETMDEAQYRQANRALSGLVLDALDPIGAIGVFVASSGAARHAHDPGASEAMRLYGALKRQDEEDFAAWGERSGKRAVIARIFNIAGPYINKHHAYALASFILEAQAGRAIAVRAPHAVMRGYVAIRELMSLAFATLLEGETSVLRFDTGGERLELSDVARAVARQLGPVPVERAAFLSEKCDDYVGDGQAYGALLLRHGIDPVPLAAQIAETADFLK